MAHLFTTKWPFQITLLLLSIFDLENVIDAKTVVTFKEYILLTCCFQYISNSFIIISRKMINFMVNVLLFTFLIISI